MKRPEWKQRGPKDQATVIIMALDWLVEGIGDGPPEYLAERMKHRTREIKDLCQDYLPEKW